MGCAVSKRPARADALVGYQIQEVLGAGAYGQVRACVEEATGQARAVKIVHLGEKQHMLERMLTKGSEQDYLRCLALEEEALWMEASGQRNVLRLYTSVITKSFAFFVCEKCKTSLLEILEQELIRMDDETLHNYYYQMLCGIEHVHTKGIIHRDIKPPNFLIGYAGDVKLCDFGLSVRSKDLKRTRDRAGSPLYMSPEMMRRETYDCATDIWSLGVTIYAITFGNFPFVGDGKSREVLAKCVVTNRPPPTFEPGPGFQEPTPAMVTFIHELLEHKQKNRKTASQCLKLDPVKRFAPSTISAIGEVAATLAPSLARSLSRYSKEAWTEHGSGGHKGLKKAQSHMSLSSKASQESVVSWMRQIREADHIMTEEAETEFSECLTSRTGKSSSSKSTIQQEINIELKIVDPRTTRPSITSALPGSYLFSGVRISVVKQPLIGGAGNKSSSGGARSSPPYLSFGDTTSSYVSVVEEGCVSESQTGFEFALESHNGAEFALEDMAVVNETAFLKPIATSRGIRASFGNAIIVTSEGQEQQRPSSL